MLVHGDGGQVPVGPGEVRYVVDMDIIAVEGGQVVQHEGGNRREAVSYEDDEVAVKGRGLQDIGHIFRRRVSDVDRGIPRQHECANHKGA